MSSAASIEQHGRIACGTITVSDLGQAVSAYRDFLAHEQVEVGEIDATLAAAWGAPDTANARYAILQAPTDAKSMLRLVEVPKQSHLQDHVPALSLGWNAFEMTVRDVFALAERLADSPFDIVGPPKLVDGFTSFIPMQVFGPNGEVLFLNQVNHSDEDTDLPIAQSEVGEIFIVVLASPDREASAAEYTEQLQMDLGGTHKLRYGLINRAFEFPEETQQTITMVQNARTPFLQVDQYPAQALARTVANGGLPMGNAMVSVLETT